MKKIVVTGATSMIGVALIKEAVLNHVEVLALVRENSSKLDRLPTSHLIKTVCCDINNLKEFSMGDGNFDVFYHFAWNDTDKIGRNAPQLQAQNIITTLDAVNLARRLGCKRFVGAGSQAEYGVVEGAISSETETNPETPYGMAKWAAGALSRKLCEQYGMKFIWGRIFSVYGCLDNEGTMLSYAIDQFIKGNAAQFSAATQMWNYLNEQDAGKAFYLLGESARAFGVYCVANRESLPLKEYIKKLCEVYGPGAECSFAPVCAGVKLVGLEANVEKLEQDTGFIPSVSFEEGIGKFIAYKRVEKSKGMK